MKKENVKVELKTGDRVAAYMGQARMTGTVLDLRDGGTVWVMMDYSGTGMLWNTKQCRRLVKRKRRSVWIPVKDEGRMYACFGSQMDIHATFGKPEKPELWIEFVEKRAK